MKHRKFSTKTILMLVAIACQLLFISPVIAAQTFSYLGASGGPGGSYFSDNQTGGLRVVEVRVRAGAYIDAVQFIYEHKVTKQIITGQRHGGTGGTLHVFKLQPGEYLTRITGKHGKFVDSFQLVTSKGRSKGWGGTGGSAHYTYSAPPGSHIHGLFGRSGVFLDAVGVILSTP